MAPLSDEAEALIPADTSRAPRSVERSAIWLENPLVIRAEPAMKSAAPPAVVVPAIVVIAAGVGWDSNEESTVAVTMPVAMPDGPKRNAWPDPAHAAAVHVAAADVTGATRLKNKAALRTACLR